MSRVGVTPAESKLCSHLIKRGSRYSIRRKIPVDLQSHYGRTEIVKALGTSDRREAEQLCRVAGVKLDEEFASVRAALAASAPTQPTPATIPTTDTPIRINANEVASCTLRLHSGSTIQSNLQENTFRTLLLQRQLCLYKHIITLCRQRHIMKLFHIEHNQFLFPDKNIASAKRLYYENEHYDFRATRPFPKALARAAQTLASRARQKNRIVSRTDFAH